MAKRLFLSHTAAASGAELALLRLARHLDPESTAVAFASDGPLVAEFRAAGVEAHVLSAEDGTLGVKRHERSFLSLTRSLWLLVRYGWFLGRWIRDNDVSVVIAYSIKSLLYGAVAARRARVPLIWSVHDRIAPDSFGRVNAFIIRVVGLISSTGIIVNSRVTRSTVWAYRKPVMVLPPGIETSGSQRTPHLCRPIGRIAMVGRLCAWKGQLEFVEAFESVFAETDVEALIIGGALFGEQEYEDALKKRVGSGPCSSQIRFTGAVDNVVELLLNSQVMVHASTIPEPFGAVVLEGMDAGCAVVATRPGGPAEIITDGVDGLLVPCGDVEALEAALRRLKDDEGLRDRLAQKGVARAAAFDIGNLAVQAEAWLARLE